VADAPKQERQSEDQWLAEERERELAELGPPRPVDPEVEADREERIRQHALDRTRSGDKHVWRPVVFEGMFAQHEFNEGKVAPVAITQIMWTSLPWVAQAFAKVVPEAYVAVDLNDDGYSAATVTCPCGSLHEVEIGTVVSGECGRFFAWFGKEVRVARPDSEAASRD
jgi:hypothetical protein